MNLAGVYVLQKIHLHDLMWSYLLGLLLLTIAKTKLNQAVSVIHLSMIHRMHNIGYHTWLPRKISVQDIYTMGMVLID